MANFKKNATYYWDIKDDKGETVDVLVKYTAIKAYRVFGEMKKEKPGLKLYCNGELVGV